MKSYTVYLLRHGLTKGNLNAQYIGHTDYPLSTFGIEQLKEIKKEHPYPEVDAVFVSPLKRSKRVGRSSAGIPQPVSCTRMVRKSPSKQREILIVPPEGIASAAFRIRFRKS